MKRLFGLLAAGLACSAADARFMMPELVPADRLVKNAEAFVQKNPRDAAGYYTLGRIHYLAFVLKVGSVPAHRADANGRPQPAPDHLIGQPIAILRRKRAEELARADLGISEEAARANPTPAYLQAVTTRFRQLEKEPWRPPEIPREELVAHAAEAVAAFRKAMELDPKNALPSLGLGSLLDQFAEWNSDEKIASLPAALSGDLRVSARDQYFAAWSRAAPQDRQARFLPVGGLSTLVSFEAGRGFLRLAEENAAALPEPQRNAIPEVKASIAKLEKLPPGAITPLVVALTPVPRLADLLAAEPLVEFDLRGLGAAESWPWLKPNAGLLVWDPHDRRAITSGRQLFGNYTFQIFWKNGYDALRALDDNGDQHLAGTELDGISIWFDRDRNGRSSDDEVAPVTHFGICSLAVNATAFDGPHPINRAGVTFRDGRILPSWDWIAEPARP